MNIFQQAAKTSLRFNTTMSGRIAVEDLWTLPLTELDKLAISYKKELESTNTESFIKTSTTKNKILQLQFDVCFAVIQIRLEDAKKARTAKERKELRSKIMETIANKKDTAMQAKSLKSLEKMLEEAEAEEEE